MDQKMFRSLIGMDSNGHRSSLNETFVYSSSMSSSVFWTQTVQHMYISTGTQNNP